MSTLFNGHELVMVSNRLPVHQVFDADGVASWQTAPGGLVTAVEPVVRELGCLWVGWAGGQWEEFDPCEIGSMRLVPVALDRCDIEYYYEGFANGTIWPLYHDVIAQPAYHRQWWERYQLVNARFAERVAQEAARGAVVWVHDYQLQLVPEILRGLRPDLTIAFFLHIPFPPSALFAQLPWRGHIVRGMLGADLIGFQRATDALSFRVAAEKYGGASVLGNTLVLSESADRLVPSRAIVAQEFPISIDAGDFAEMAESDSVLRRAREIREELGNPHRVMLGVDRLDYTKGIRHRLKAFDELLSEGEVSAADTVLVQVASPSRERVEAYQQLRDEVELTVGRMNGAYGTIGHSPVVYLHRGYSREEMVALYLAADVLVVTPLRDGMNLVAKEYVASRTDGEGVLLLSEFAGASDQLQAALLVNPHDIEGLKAAMLRALHMPVEEQRRRMGALRESVKQNDVSHWTKQYLGAVSDLVRQRNDVVAGARAPSEIVTSSGAFVPRTLRTRLRRLATASTLIVASDFDGTLAPIVSRPEDARMLPRAQQALEVLQGSPGVCVVLLTGRSLDSVLATGLDGSGWVFSGSHGAEFAGRIRKADGTEVSLSGETLDERERERLITLTRRLERVFGAEPGVRLERKPFGVAVHTRLVVDDEQAEELMAAAVELGAASGCEARYGKRVREFQVRRSDKGRAFHAIRSQLPTAPALFLGDDVTDEDVFCVLGHDDLGVKVGSGETGARERVENPETAAAVLAMLAELRTGKVVGSSV